MLHSNTHRNVAKPDYYIQVEGIITQDKDPISTMRMKIVNSPGIGTI